MSRYFLDSWAWVEYLDGSSVGKKVRDMIFDQRNEIFTHSVSAAEIISKGERRGKDTESIWAVMNSNSKLVVSSLDDSKVVGLLHAEVKSKNRNFGLADAFVLAAARKIGAKVLTGDPDFRGIPDAIMLK